MLSFREDGRVGSTEIETEKEEKLLRGEVCSGPSNTLTTFRHNSAGSRLARGR